MKKPGNLFRIWDKVNEKYYSTGKKSIWKSYKWAASTMNDLRWPMDDFEIHELETVIVDRTPGEVAAAEIQLARRIKKEAKERIDKVREEVKELVPYGGFWNIYEQWKKKLWTEDLMEKLTPLFKEYNRLGKL